MGNMERAVSHLVVAGFMARGDEVLLVHQQGPEDPEPGWSLPGGVVDEGELVHEALVREVHEETGLRIGGPVRLLFCAQYALPQAPWAGTWTAFTFEVAAQDGELPDNVDPAGIVLEARWVSRAEAVRLLSAIPFAPMRDPVVAHLNGHTEIPALWLYPEGVDAAPLVVPPLRR